MALVGWWPLDGNTNDYTVNNRTLTNNGAVVSTGGKIGNTYLFSTNGMLMPSIPLPVNQNLYELSITAWIFPTETPPAHGYNIVSLSQNSGIRFRLDTLNRIWVYYYNGTTNYSFTSTAVELNKWTHISVILKAGELSVYINGVKNNSSTASSFIYISSSGNGSIGQYSTSIEVWKGYLNDIRIYDNALSQKEINDLVKAKVLNYNFNKDDGAIVYDGSGLKRNGTINGATWTDEGYNFDGNDYINVDFNNIGNLINIEHAVSFSLKTNTTKNCGVFGTANTIDNTVFGIMINRGNTGRDIYAPNYLLVYYRSNVNTYFTYTIYAPELFDNNWHHIVLKTTNAFTLNSNIYIDGVLKTKTILDSNLSGSFTTFSNSFRLGDLSRALPDSTTFLEGILKDFNFYATALSDENILDLYQTRAKIDNQGNLYANEFVEDYEVASGLTLNQLFSNNKVLNGDFTNGLTSWTARPNLTNVSVLNGILTFTGSGAPSSTINNWFEQPNVYLLNNTYYRVIKYKTGASGTYYFTNGYTNTTIPISIEFSINTSTFVPSSGPGFRFDHLVLAATSGSVFTVDYIKVYNLTETFGAGNEPTLTQMDAWYRDYSQSRTKSNGQIITNEFNEVGVDTIAYENKTYKEIFEFDDDFSGNTLDTTKWDILSPSGLTIDISNGTIKLTKNSSGLSGIVSKISISPGKKIVVRSRVTSGRHGSLISLGRGNFFPFPHSGTSGTFGVSLYGRHEIATSTSSFRDENNNFGFADNLGNPNEFLVYEIRYVNTNQMLVYRNGLLVHTINGLFNNTYYPYFTLDNFSLPNGLEVDYIYSTSINLFAVQPTQAQMDQLYTEYRQLKIEEQALRIFKDKIHIQGSLNEGGQ
jgi:hypothetical protein